MKTCGFLNKIAIGMASGKAVIGWEYNWNAFEHARNHEHYIGVRTTKEFRRTVTEALEGKSDINAIGACARALMRNSYSWDSVATRMEAVYRQLLPRSLVHDGDGLGDREETHRSVL
jgi:glycosyltransferase involved in cell wall biosynthesis